jgi:hypothetical protein
VASVSPPPGIVDPTPGNDSATDSNAVTSTTGGGGGPDRDPPDWFTDGPLSVTGSEIARLLYLGATLIFVGGILVLRRRRGLRRVEN